MTDEDWLEDLLLRWEEKAEASAPVSAEELCRECPHLLDALKKRIAALQEIAWVSRLGADALAPPANGPSPVVAHAEPVPGYRLVRLIGRGGFGQVWQAVGPDGSALALKLIPWSEKASVEWRAFEVLKGIRHPHLLATHAAWQTADFLVISLELADRTLLDRWHEAKEQGLPGIPETELLRLFQQAAQAIDFLHEQGIQHRDVKPANLLLVGDTLKVADFGLARVLAHSITGHTGNLTLAYAAPEFFDGKTSRQSDQYCLAATYCQLRGGHLPFEGTAAQIVAGHLQRPPDLSMLAEHERPAVARALAKRPDERWPSCGAFVEAIPSAGSSKPVAPFRIRWNRPLPWLLAALFVTALSLIAFLVKGPSSPTVPVPKEGFAFVRNFDLPPGRASIRSVAAGYVGAPFNSLVAFSNSAEGPTLWDVETGKIIRHFQRGFGPGAALAPFTAAAALTGGEDGSVILWDLAQGKETRRFKGHTSSVSCVAFSPDGKRVLSGSCDATVRLWDRATGQELFCCRGHQGFVMSVAFSPNGRLALSAGWDGSTRLWNLDDGKQMKVFEGVTSKLWSVAFDWDGRLGCSGGTDRTIRVYDLQSGEESRRLEGHQSGINELTFLGYERLLSVAGDNLILWDVGTGREIAHSPKLSSDGRSVCVCYLDGVAHALVGTERDGIQLWRLP